MPDWLYHQSTGDLFYLNGININPIEKCYSVYGDCKNKPEFQGVKNLGPIPQGKYTLGSFTEIAGGRIKKAVPLTPHVSNNMLGRDGFYIHGENQLQPGEASEGCIICSVNTRDLMVASIPSILHVEKGP